MTRSILCFIGVCWMGIALGCSNAGTTVPVSATFKLASIRSFDCAQAPIQFEFDVDGNLWLRSERVFKFTPAGQQLAAIDVPVSTDMAVDRQGNLWVTNQYNSLVKFAPDGREMWRKDDHFEDWTAPPLLVTHDDAVWIRGDRLEKLDLDGHTQLAFDKPLFSDVFYRDIIEAPSGELWFVGDGLGKASSEGVPIASYLPESAIQDSAVDQQGNLWLVNLLMKNSEKGNLHMEVIKVAPDGRFLLTLPLSGTPSAVEVDQLGNVWVTSYQSDAPTAWLEKFSPDGALLGQRSFDSSVTGMAIDRAGYLWLGQYVSSHGVVTQYSIQ